MQLLHQATYPERYHRTVVARASDLFDDAERGAFTPEAEDRCETVEWNGGHTCTVLGGPGLGEWVADPEAWPGLHTLVRVRTERNRYRATDSAPCATSFPAGRWPPSPAAAGPWGIENGLHRTLDVQFREDDCRLRRGHAPAVMVILRRAAMNLVRTVQQHFRPDLSIGLLRDKIGRNPVLLAPILT
ncbi:MAG: transposase [Caldilineaceae bacterium SB0662_bin_9]|uniref:Transposase n=1 Tax=Caldilineaceae bacterium SB0662_bin_9 TaxID=2605258 RepID=A0A6B1DPU1_9CHLR|nr:transposase [Caldilineaceae bacterium SB0662_bin_9]